MTAWYIDRNRMRWRLCKIISRSIGSVTVELWDGTRLQGIARHEKYGEFVDSK